MNEPDRVQVTLPLELTEEEFWALAQFMKRLSWQEWRLNAASEEEACQMRSGCAALQRALGDAGYAPR